MRPPQLSTHGKAGARRSAGGPMLSETVRTLPTFSSRRRIPSHSRVNRPVFQHSVSILPATMSEDPARTSLTMAVPKSR
ncbi:hypothetical protein PPTG_14860 [Phytophthora nicotianae INRA-310]|uniref:Uncharacterized protein n=1 Tax=Phytophthora nicotianae (strain INRA-310) TaxID=761204 RepID=W2PXA0_PHYN3|nr:hypothetical protein PPTG_14860 [Phytophthora nicotianae INRA-310]ETN05261.1 hypothetical protein PPTG_14860 [Phytophthora nicotianae INRA-310]